MNQAQQTTPAAAITTTTEATALINQMTDVMNQLLALIEKETELVRAGKLRDASQLEATKTELARAYVAGTSRLKASHAFMKAKMPAAVFSLLEKHRMFQALLQINLTVLATAHAVSESIMRGVSDAVNRKAAPQAYGSSGHTVAPPRNSVQPLTVSRTL